MKLSQLLCGSLLTLAFAMTAHAEVISFTVNGGGMTFGNESDSELTAQAILEMEQKAERICYGGETVQVSALNCHANKKPAYFRAVYCSAQYSCK